MNCPRCAIPLVPGTDQRTQRRGLACLCGYWRETEPAPPPAPEAPETAGWDGLESGLVEAIRKALQERGYIVLRVGQRRADFAGQDAGTPDMFAARPGERWAALEVKTDTGDVRPAQAALAALGLSTVVRSVEEALRAVGVE